MVKALSTYPDIVQCDDTMIKSTSPAAVLKLVNVADEDVIVSGITLSDGEYFTVSHDSLPATVVALTITQETTESTGVVFVRDMFQMNGFMFVADNNGTITSYGINSDGSLTAAIDSVAHGGNAYGLGGYGNILFSARGIDGLTSYIVNTDGTFSEVQTNYQTGGSSSHLYATDRYVFLAHGGGGLHVYQYNGDTGEIIWLTSDDQGGTASGVYADDNFIYLANASNGVEVYSFDGSVLSHLSNYNTAGTAWHVASTGNTDILFVADDTAGLVSLSIDSVGTLALLDTNNMGGTGRARKLRWDGEFLYVGHINSTSMSVVGVEDDGTMTVLCSDSQTGASVEGLEVYNHQIYASEGANGTERYSLDPGYKLEVSCYFTPEDDTTVTDSIAIASDAVGSPDTASLEGTGLGNAENGISSYNYYEHALGRIAEQYKE